MNLGELRGKTGLDMGVGGHHQNVRGDGRG